MGAGQAKRISGYNRISGTMTSVLEKGAGGLWRVTSMVFFSYQMIVLSPRRGNSDLQLLTFTLAFQTGNNSKVVLRCCQRLDNARVCWLGARGCAKTAVRNLKIDKEMREAVMSVRFGIWLPGRHRERNKFSASGRSTTNLATCQGWFLRAKEACWSVLVARPLGLFQFYLPAQLEVKKHAVLCLVDVRQCRTEMCMVSCNSA